MLTTRARHQRALLAKVATVILVAAVVLTPSLDNVDLAGLRAALITPTAQPLDTALLAVEQPTSTAELEQT